MSSKYKDFFDIPSPQAKVETPAPIAAPDDSVGEKHKEFFSLPSDPNSSQKEAKPDVPVTEQLKNVPGIAAREGLAQIWSAPTQIAELWRFLGKKFSSLGEDLAAEEGREISDDEKKLTEFFINAPFEATEYLREKFPTLFPTHAQAKDRLSDAYEKREDRRLPEEPRGFIERGAEGLGKAIPSLLLPGSGAVKGTALATSAATEALDLSEGAKLGANLTLPALTAIIQAIVQRRYVPSSADAERLLERGRELGMSDTQLAPILATEGQIERHGMLAAGKRQTRKAFEETGEALGGVYENLKSRPSSIAAAPAAVETTLLKEFEEILTDFKSRTHSPAPHEQQLIEFLETAIEDIHQNGTSGRKLMNTLQSMNQVGGGRTALRRIEEPVLKALDAIDPALAKDFQAANALYGRFKANLREINPTQFDAFINAGEMQQLLGAVFQGRPLATGQAVLNIASLNTLRRISSLILTNPTAQSLVRNFGKAVRSGSNASARAVGIQLKNYLQKEEPDLAKDVDWKALGIED